MKTCIVVVSLALTGFCGSAFCQEMDMIIDHRCTDINKVPESAVKKAKEQFVVAYGHTSHGSQVVGGMEALMKSNPLYAFGPNASDGKTLKFIDNFMPGDLGGDWAAATRDYLQRNPNSGVNVVMWSWCGQASSATQESMDSQYLQKMSALEKEYPKIKFVYMTGHLDGSGEQGNLNKRNEQIRAFCKKNNKILFDFADIESYDPDGKVNYMKLGATDGCDYKDGETTKNWADEWLKRNPDNKIALPEYAAHSRPLNGAMKGRAFWWMMARMSGWEPKAE